MKKLSLLAISISILFCIVPIIPSYSPCSGTFVPKIEKDNGTDAEGYHIYQTIGDEKYPIKYKISSNATLEQINFLKIYPEITIFIKEVSQGGNITIQLPAKLLTPYNEDYTISVGGCGTGDFYEDFPKPIESNSDHITISHPLSNYSNNIEIITIQGNSTLDKNIASENYLLNQQNEQKIQNEHIVILLPPLIIGIGIGATAFFVIFHKTRIK